MPDDEIQNPEERSEDEASVAGGSEGSGSDGGQVPEESLKLQDEDDLASAVVLDGPKAPDGGHALPFPVVAIGGSAGALEAFIEFFENVPDNTGMAFVVVLHLAPRQESHLSEIIGRHTTMPTITIKEGLAPEENRVYIIPPNVQASLGQGKFHLEPRPATGAFLPIDAMFLSLAAEQTNYGIGVVLSGMDGDGAVGLRAIKGEGGFSMVQSPDSAKHAEMPRASIASDHVDMVLRPDLIGRHIAGLAQRFGDPGWRQFEEGEPSADDERIFGRIVRLLKSVSGVDFRLYKPTTIRRRIARRMLMSKIESITDYALYLQGHAAELRDLQEDILINVTRFFRDTDVFDTLKIDYIPRIYEGREPEEQVRIWVAGCATGEEVYSLAMLLIEHMTGRPVGPNVQIFGTDASEQNIQRARTGVYAESIVNEVSPERLRRFFIKTDKGFQIAKRVRDLCIFARQNLCTDPPFSRLDMVSCRNVLIYFGPELQRQVISTFHYALRQDGYLLLGNSETIREFAELFTFSDRAHKIFIRRGEFSLPAIVGTTPQLQFPSLATDTQALQPSDHRKEFDLSRLADRIVLARYGPPGVVINEQMDILQSRGRPSPFIEMAPGVASLQLARMTRESIAPEVMAAVSRAIEHDLPVQVSGLRVVDGGEVREARMEVLPMHSAATDGKYYLILFPPQDGDAVVLAPFMPSPLLEKEPERSIAQLQHDLTSTKLYLQLLLDERDSKNQELVSANEEIQSANEELQSTNEELETTKEELQSSNEELQTVNDELSNRNAVLTEATNDLTNLLNSVNLPVLMLSNELNIRHFTPQTQKLMNVRATDVGRPFGEIRLNLVVEDLEAHVREVLETLTAREMELQDRDGHWYLLRMRPYRTRDNKIEGVVLVLVDIDELRRSQHELRDARDFAASVIANIPLPLVAVDSSFRIFWLNEAFCGLSRMTRGSLEGRPLTDIAAGLWNMENQLRSLFEQVQLDPAADSSFECEHGSNGDAPRTLLVRGQALRPNDESFMLVTFEDVTAHKEVEKLLKREGERLAEEVAVTTRELDQSRQELRALTDSLMTSQEDERRRVARELHDDVSQRMALLDMDCGAALDEMQTDPESAREKLESVRVGIAQISQDVRTMSHRLHPAMIEHLGAAAALESLMDEFAKRDRMLTTFFTERVPDDIPVDVATGLYRIAQEALRNVAKHAGKSHVKVSLTGGNGGVKLEVADSGAGFDVQEHTPGLGLVSMKERARLIGATLTVHSAPRQGTRVEVFVPLPENRVN